MNSELPPDVKNSEGLCKRAQPKLNNGVVNYELPQDENLFLDTNDRKWPANFRKYFFYYFTRISR